MEQVQPQTIITLVATVATILTALGVIFKGRGENKNKADEIKNALDKAIDERVAKQLESAWKEIDDLKTSDGVKARAIARLQEEVRRERNARRTLRSVFISYVERVQTGGDSQLSPAEKNQLDVIEDDDFPTEGMPAAAEPPRL